MQQHTYIALLRGINVGGSNILKMADLRDFLRTLGYEEPRTLLQSGNAVFRGGKHDDKALEVHLEQETRRRLGLPVQFFVRELPEWKEVIQSNPFPKEAVSDPSHLLVHFMKDPVAPSTIEEVRSENEGTEQLALLERHIFVTYPAGIGNSKLGSHTGWAKLFASGTARNWNTILKLGALAEASAEGRF